MLATERLPELLADLVAALETALATLSFRLAAHLARLEVNDLSHGGSVCAVGGSGGSQGAKRAAPNKAPSLDCPARAYSVCPTRFCSSLTVSYGLQPVVFSPHTSAHLVNLHPPPAPLTTRPCLFRLTALSAAPSLRFTETRQTCSPRFSNGLPASPMSSWPCINYINSTCSQRTALLVHLACFRFGFGRPSSFCQRCLGTLSPLL